MYQRTLRLSGKLVLAISQSGNSDDLIAFASHAKGAGALTVAVTNETASPLAAACEFVLPVGAGPERSIAATKTFVATAAALLRLVCAWVEDANILNAVRRLPDGLPLHRGWTGVEPRSAFNSTRLATIGRGPTLGMVREAALKLKETCNLPPRPSAVRVSPRPNRPGAPELSDPAVHTDGCSGRGYAPALQRPRCKGATLLIADTIATVGIALPVLPAEQPEADALCLCKAST